MLVVISPAKKLDYSSSIEAPLLSQPALLDHAEELSIGLKALAPQDVSGLMHLSDKLGALNYERFQEWQTPFNADNARAAVLAFKGDVYQGLDADSMSAEDLHWAQDHLRILSGLYGVLRPLDLMQAYRLEMGTKFASQRGKDQKHLHHQRTERRVVRMRGIGSVWHESRASREGAVKFPPAFLFLKEESCE